jgi:hypothetical protein
MERTVNHLVWNQAAIISPAGMKITQGAGKE